MASRAEISAGNNLEHLTLQISTAEVEFVSQGFFGEVYRVPYDGVLCAAKYRSPGDNRYKIEQFELECLLHSKLHHPNIVRMLGVCYNEINQPYKVMELLELNLRSAVVEFEAPMYVTLAIVQDVSRGLDYLHTRSPPIVHSYLTMEVILLTSNLVAKIGGFTFSVEMTPETKRLLELTAHSTSDEVLNSSLHCGPPFDICSFGWLICKAILKYHYTINMYKFLRIESFGKPLTVHAVNIGQYEPQINLVENTSLKQLIKDCMNRNPNFRPSASVIDETVANIIKGEFYFLVNNIVLSLCKFEPCTYACSVYLIIIFYYIKLKSRPSVRPSVRSFLVAWISAVDARIDVKLARNEAPVFWDYEVYF